MTNQEKIHYEIDKQITAGFSISEIRQNLLAQNFPPAETDEALKHLSGAEKKEPARSSGADIISILVSVYFIINGSMRLSSNPSGSGLHTWGIIMLSVGIIGVTWKSVDFITRKIKE